MKPTIKITMASFLIVLMLAGCSQPTTASTLPTFDLSVSTHTISSINANLVAKGVIVPQEQEAELAFIASGNVESVNVKIGDTIHTGNVLIQLDTVILKAELSHAESAVKAAKAEYEYQKIMAEAAFLTSEIMRLQTAVELAAAKVGLAEADLVVAQNLLKQATMTAPFDGTILDVQVVPGEMVYNGRTVIKMIALQNLQVETIDLNEIDIPRIYIDQPASVYINALNTNVEGVVIKISPQASLIGENKVYKVTILLNDQPDGLRWGMSTEIKFSVDK